MSVISELNKPKTTGFPSGIPTRICTFGVTENLDLWRFRDVAAAAAGVRVSHRTIMMVCGLQSSRLEEVCYQGPGAYVYTTRCL